MLIGLLMILLPAAVFILTLPLSRRLTPGLRKAYQVLGGLTVFAGGGFTVYLASSSGDQGGIAAYFFQIAVILAYAVLSATLVILNWIIRAWDSRKTDS